MSLEDLEKRVPHLEQTQEAIQNLLLIQGARNKAEFEAVKARMSELDVSILDLRQTVGGLQKTVITLKDEIAALPRALAEMLDERDRRRS